MSYCDDNEKCTGVFQCNDNGLILFSQFCDEIVDCFDGSDEIQNQPGFKCNRCILPQSNLYDDFAHCDDSSDLCFGNNCFSCFDKRLLISFKQVCDGVIDCYDMSDECLCEAYFDTEMCLRTFDDEVFRCFDNENLPPWSYTFNTVNAKYLSKSPFIECYTKYNSSIYATLCDDRPECKNYRDECGCENPPDFCNDNCHNKFPMGDRYCDDVEDPAWKFISDSSCPQGFDELFCPKRYRCNAAGKISIDILQICDGIADCDDESDEQDCPVAASIQSIFASDTEMIANPFIKALFWIMGFTVLAGNAYVIIFTSIFLIKKKTIDFMGFHQVIVLNISIADFIMGIYLLTIAIHSTLFKGSYGKIDHEWRSSLKCSLIGSLAVISSEASCFLMVVLAAFKMRNITNALGSLTASSRPWKFCLIASWLLSIILSLAPTYNLTSKYFLHSFSLSISVHHELWFASKLKKLACRIAALSNTTIPFNGDEFQSAKMFIKYYVLDNFNSSIEFFGYYGETSVCMPRFYVGIGESSWEYTIFIITINLFSFLFIALSSIYILKYMSQNSRRMQECQINKPKKQAARMQKRIARIIITDFCCWIPICIMAYVRLGVEFSDIAYQISAVVLLPINSAINPFLFTSLPDKLINACLQKYHQLIRVTKDSETDFSELNKTQSQNLKLQTKTAILTILSP